MVYPLCVVVFWFGRTMKGTYQVDLSILVKAERQLADRVDRLCLRLNRLDGMDEDRRSEMYAILQALKHESQFSLTAFDALLAEAGRQGTAHV